ncbi:MAG: putative glycolipid-binding domain-containing protein [Acidimicrobiia bacterium]|nr:putative glycolipid-binding domain-containing protein [Acidimicrobiia bacterium]
MTPAEKPERSHEQTFRWSAVDGTSSELCNLAFENEGWTADGQISAPDVHWVLRVTAGWELRQFMLFRDLPEADLWLATDGRGRWLEVNGAVRDDLRGCSDVHLPDTPFPYSIPMRRLDLPVGEGIEIETAVVDTTTLGILPTSLHYRRVAPDRWTVRHPAPGPTVELTVDPSGIVVDQLGTFTRIR